MKRRSTAGALALLLAGCATVPQNSAAPAIAITIDDMPVHGEMPPGETPASVARQVISALRAEGITTAVGFINGSWTEREPSTMEVLTEWRAAGLPLANHGWSHRHFNEMTPAEFEQEVARNEPLLQRLSGGNKWRWFRYPFLDEGETAEKRITGRQILARRGYKVAAVTMDFSDWQWTDPYVRCRKAGDEAAIARLEESFLAAARESIGYYRGLSQSLYGRDIPYVLLLHVSGFEGRMLPRLLDLYKREGFRFVSLDEAQSDPAYADQMNPALPPEPQGLERKAPARGITLPARTVYAPMLAAICPGTGPTASIP